MLANSPDNNAARSASPPGADGGESTAQDAEHKAALILIDPRQLTRECLVAALEGAGGEPIIAVGDAAELPEPIDGAAAVRAAILNLASDDFQEAGLRSMLAPLRARLPACPILLLSEQLDAAHAAVAFRQKIQALLSARMPLTLAISAIQFVELGWMLFPEELFPNLLNSGLLAHAAEEPTEGQLTPRQKEVLQQLRAGASNKAIAAHLAISERTVKAHVKAIMRHFGAANRTQVVAMVADGLVAREQDPH